MRNRYALDTEFNGFDGELISIGLAPFDASYEPFYRVVEWSNKPVPWVGEHVIPHLGADPIPRAQAARELSRYLSINVLTGAGLPVIVADWPSDFVHFLNLFILGPGTMVGVVDFTLEYRPLPGFVTADHSTVPHHALHDAIALRDYLIQMCK
jgi:hypothetical protein